jgi:choline dehydrogenase-like flavoprotein
MPAPRMVYRIDDNSHALCDWHIERATESLFESGAWNVRVDLRYPANGHFMGTARMGDDPTHSVVDRWCMAHDSRNLGIIDGSVFVTSGGVNPTSTISALALRAADHLIENRGSIPRPESG